MLSLGLSILGRGRVAGWKCWLAQSVLFALQASPGLQPSTAFVCAVHAPYNLFPMTPEIAHYWQEYDKLLDRHLSDPETPSTMHEIRDGLNRLVERVEREISASHAEAHQLSRGLRLSTSFPRSSP